MRSISSYLPADTYNSLEKDGDLTFLHTMLRVDDLEKTMAFFSALGLKETRRKESEKGKFTLVFMASAPGAPEIELTSNHSFVLLHPKRKTASEVNLSVQWFVDNATTHTQKRWHICRRVRSCLRQLDKLLPRFPELMALLVVAMIGSSAGASLFWKR